ncbi:cytochrome c oxidase assembly protein [Mesorhizobium sanjuanii]|uniref:cytochrome c oxidase assembly protein n=1 Tax=Mesorhizobium sanjuanii TaxID=2037900 RepID=UPI0013FD2B56|nr:cytochrome c oxidase assembly protein [Mesorhizobium sanjuanii]
MQYASYAGIGCLGLVLSWLSKDHPTAMPIWAPWDFSTPEYLATALVLLWFMQGLSSGAAMPIWRRVAFLTGLGLIYAVLQTHFEYCSQHMFFLNRIQHVVMHHLGPFLIALGGAGETIRRGMPAPLRQAITAKPVVAAMRILQQPFLAALIFSGSFAFWLIPSVHFRAMLDPRLYAVMNWTMVLDGILFWSLVLDPRPKPPARVSHGTRIALSVGVMFPQIVMGAIVSLSPRDLYPYYNLCGRIFPSMGAINDQHIGGLIIWIPPAMMSVVGMLVVLNGLRLHEDSIREVDKNAASLAALSSRWTGR